VSGGDRINGFLCTTCVYRCYPFLRSAEFLWQEGHTAPATGEGGFKGTGSVGMSDRIGRNRTGSAGLCTTSGVLLAEMPWCGIQGLCTEGLHDDSQEAVDSAKERHALTVVM
jgi:hypothetical protein